MALYPVVTVPASGHVDAGVVGARPRCIIACCLCALAGRRGRREVMLAWLGCCWRRSDVLWSFTSFEGVARAVIHLRFDYQPPWTLLCGLKNFPCGEAVRSSRGKFRNFLFLQKWMNSDWNSQNKGGSIIWGRVQPLRQVASKILRNRQKIKSSISLMSAAGCRSIRSTKPCYALFRIWGRRECKSQNKAHRTFVSINNLTLVDHQRREITHGIHFCW